MKRSHGFVSSTPLFLQKKGRTSSKQHGLLGTPVEGLTDILVSASHQQSGFGVCNMFERAFRCLLQIDTPDSDDRPQRAIPDTTQRRLEGFCLSTPLSLSQAAQQEVRAHRKQQHHKGQHCPIILCC